MKSKIERFDEIWNGHSTSFQDVMKGYRSVLISFFDCGYDFRKDEQKELEANREHLDAIQRT